MSLIDNELINYKSQQETNTNDVEADKKQFAGILINDYKEDIDNFLKREKENKEKTLKTQETVKKSKWRSFFKKIIEMTHA